MALPHELSKCPFSQENQIKRLSKYPQLAPSNALIMLCDVIDGEKSFGLRIMPLNTAVNRAVA